MRTQSVHTVDSGSRHGHGRIDVLTAIDRYTDYFPAPKAGGRFQKGSPSTTPPGTTGHRGGSPFPPVDADTPTVRTLNDDLLFPPTVVFTTKETCLREERSLTLVIAKEPLVCLALPLFYPFLFPTVGTLYADPFLPRFGVLPGDIVFFHSVVYGSD